MPGQPELPFVVDNLSAAAISKQQSKTSGTRDDAGWEGWRAQLKAYKRRHGDCNVPVRWTGDPRLGRWAKEQRSLKKLLDRGEPMGGRGKGKMTAERAAKLEALGFA